MTVSDTTASDKQTTNGMGERTVTATEAVPVAEVGLRRLLDLQEHGPDTFVGIAPRYPWGRLFGGQVVAQALRAAQRTVDADLPVHSLHAYFIRGGTHTEPVRFEVDRLRNGRSFHNRLVVARQSSGAILNLACSFQHPEDEADVQTSSPPADIPGPEQGEDTGWGSGLLQRRSVISEPSHTVTWVRLAAEPLDDPELVACALAFLSDSVPTGAVRSAHPIQVPRSRIRETFVGASLDHVVYFQRPPADTTGWFLSDARCHGLVGGRGVSVADLYDDRGTQVLTIVQEVLLRERRSGLGGETGLRGKDI